MSSHIKNTSNPSQKQDREGELDIPIPIIAAGITVLGAIGVAVLVHILSKRREAVARFSVAAREFISAFAVELAVLESNQDIQWLNEFLFNAYETKHKSAIATFIHFVPESSRAAFNAACEQYHSGHQRNGDGFGYESMFVEYIALNTSENMRKIAAERIHAMLEFAKTK